MNVSSNIALMSQPCLMAQGLGTRAAHKSFVTLLCCAVLLRALNVLSHRVCPSAQYHFGTPPPFV